jgi:hypothetical protein
MDTLKLKNKKEFEEDENNNDSFNQFDNQIVLKKIKNKNYKKKILIITIGLIIVVLGIFAYYKLYYNTEAAKQRRADAKVAALVKKISKIILLPEGQKPAVFDIEDPKLLIGKQAFFAGSEKGDKLLIYAESSKAIIYSPKKDIIVNVGPVTFDTK